MNGPSLIDSAGRAPPGPLSRDPFGNKAGEAARGGFLQLKRALTGGPPQQVRFLCAASVSGNLGTCAPRSGGVSFLNRAWEAGSSCSAEQQGLG